METRLPQAFIRPTIRTTPDGQSGQQQPRGILRPSADSQAALVRETNHRQQGNLLPRFSGKLVVVADQIRSVQTIGNNRVKIETNDLRNYQVTARLDSEPLFTPNHNTQQSSEHSEAVHRGTFAGSLIITAPSGLSHPLREGNRVSVNINDLRNCSVLSINDLRTRLTANDMQRPLLDILPAICINQAFLMLDEMEMAQSIRSSYTTDFQTLLSGLESDQNFTEWFIEGCVSLPSLHHSENTELAERISSVDNYSSNKPLLKKFLHILFNPPGCPYIETARVCQLLKNQGYMPSFPVLPQR
ncbi:hypothetical protein [Endozoicomonas elysicola]|uniref:Uncharacterized protein n=1 Tax=Endozoicomonas elysicola TaxID=305900 RepID=A0A081K7F7_9GAMM|nr:hypothetical protein [Endozoicomonas elysicola]KEI70083.1 hypothetical protein GV64_04380 [Endozoicomonas elysicola]